MYLAAHYKKQFRYKRHQTHSWWLALVAICIPVLASLLYISKVTAPQDQQSLPFPISPIISYFTHKTPFPPPVAKGYGIAAGSSLTSLKGDALTQRLSNIRASGAGWIRFDFNWADIQPKDSKDFNWSTYDLVVDTAGKQNLQILGIIDYTPEWARAAACKNSMQCPPADTTMYANFAAQVAERYASHGVHYWEIWNEPNNPQFWQPKADPRAYTQLLQQSYDAIKNNVPDSYIITGGLSPQATTDNSYAPVDFLAAIYRDGAKDSFDGVADHPYTFPLSPTSSADHAWNQMARLTKSMRSVMTDNGDGAKKVWITEFGAPTGGPGAVATIANPNLDARPYVVDEALQAKILSDALTLYKSYDWVGPFFCYTYQDPGTDPSTNENFFGLTHHDGSAKPALNVFKQAATE